MGINVVSGSAPLQEIIFDEVSGGSNAGNGGAIYKNKIVPAGAYEVSLIPHGTVTVTSGSANNNDMYPTTVASAQMAAYDIVSGRPISFFTTLTYANNDPVSGVFHIPKDAYLQIVINNSGTTSNLVRSTVVLKPVNNPLFRVQTGFSASTQTQYTSSGTMHFMMGWDYDVDEPVVIFNSGSSNVNAASTNGSFRQFDSGFFIVRKISGTWTQRYYSHGLAAGNTWYSTLKPGIDNACPTGNGAFYVRNNTLHWFHRQGVLLDSSSRRWGWIKADISAASGTISWAPGHSNTNFAESSSSIGSTNSGQMLYWYDARTHKVVFNGYREASNTDNLNARWIEYDIIADTVTTTYFGSYNAYVYTTGYGYLWDSYWVDTERGYFGGFSQGQSSVPQVIMKFAKDGSQAGHRSYPNIYYTNAASSTNQPVASSRTAYAGRKALHFYGFNISHYYISGGGKTASNPWMNRDTTGFPNSNAGLHGNSGTLSQNTQVTQIMFADKKICTTSIMQITLVNQFSGTGLSTSFTHPFIQVATAPRTITSENLLLNNLGGIYDPTLSSGNGITWLPDVASY